MFNTSVRQLKINWRLLLGIIISIIFIAWIQWKIGWPTLLQPWQKIKPTTLMTAMSLLLATYILRAIRVWDFFFPTLKNKVATIIKIVVIHNFLNNFLPMRSGEASFPILMRKYFNIPVTQSVSSLVWLRLFDLHIILGFGLVFFVAQFFPFYLFDMIFMFWVILPIGLYLLGKFYVTTTKSHNKNCVIKAFFKFIQTIPNNAWSLIRLWTWSFVNWALKLAVMAFIFTRFDNISLKQALPGMVCGELGSVLPIHGIAGLGTYEAAILVGLIPQHLAMKPAISAAINLHLFMLSGTILSMLFAQLIPTNKSSSIDLEKP